MICNLISIFRKQSQDRTANLEEVPVPSKIIPKQNKFPNKKSDSFPITSNIAVMTPGQIQPIHSNNGSPFISNTFFVMSPGLEEMQMPSPNLLNLTPYVNPFSNPPINDGINFQGIF